MTAPVRLVVAYGLLAAAVVSPVAALVVAASDGLAAGVITVAAGLVACVIGAVIERG